MMFLPGGGISNTRAVRTTYRVVVLLANQLYSQAKTQVSTPDFGDRCHLIRPRTARDYSGTRMDTVWADRQAFVFSADTTILTH